MSFTNGTLIDEAFAFHQSKIAEAIFRIFLIQP